jgi:phosphoribosylformimino-5-aminoimidazole carboxamide ribotide isomerase
VHIYPAIDIKRGKVVRLFEGERSSETVYADDPVAQAERFLADGATWLHVVDLDRAFATGGDNTDCIRSIARLRGATVQLGGLVRTRDQVRDALEAGVARVVATTAVLLDPALLDSLLREAGAERLAVAIDVRQGTPALRGSDREITASAAELARRAAQAGARTLVYRDLERDGLLTGFDHRGAAALRPFAGEVIVSGGGASLEDLRAARAAGLAGAIVGRALYDGRFTLREAIACSR